MIDRRQIGEPGMRTFSPAVARDANLVGVDEVHQPCGDPLVAVAPKKLQRCPAPATPPHPDPFLRRPPRWGADIETSSVVGDSVWNAPAAGRAARCRLTAAEDQGCRAQICRTAVAHQAFSRFRLQGPARVHSRSAPTVHLSAVLRRLVEALPYSWPRTEDVRLAARSAVHVSIRREALPG